LNDDLNKAIITHSKTSRGSLVSEKMNSHLIKGLDLSYFDPVLVQTFVLFVSSFN